MEFQDTDAKEKHKKFAVENSGRSAVFLIEILMEETYLVLARNYFFQNRGNSKQMALFRVLGTA